MKRIVPLILLVLISTTASAQLFKKKSNASDRKYLAGAVTTINNRVVFEKEILAEGVSADQIEERANAWIQKRFVKPTIISKKIYDSDPGTILIKAEEYIVFKNKFFVLDRSRIQYFLTITSKDGKCNFNMARITYWYDDEDDKGGMPNMSAEEWITDENAIGKDGKSLKKFPGKFRRKTIDLKDLLIEELTDAVTNK